MEVSNTCKLSMLLLLTCSKYYLQFYSHKNLTFPESTYISTMNLFLKMFNYQKADNRFLWNSRFMKLEIMRLSASYISPIFKQNKF